jgi:hypothetical protein
VQSPLYSMALVLDETRAICLVGDEKGQVRVIRIHPCPVLTEC